MKRTPEETLKIALYHIEKAISHSKRDLDDELTIDACSMQLFAGLDSLCSFPDNLAEKIFGEKWVLMRGMRNRIAHGYFMVSKGILISTVNDNLPDIAKAINKYLETNPGG